MRKLDSKASRNAMPAGIRPLCTAVGLCCNCPGFVGAPSLVTSAPPPASFLPTFPAEGPLRQCVQSLVDKTWQELQPSWMSDLAAQQPAADAGALAAADGSGGAGGEGGAGGGVDAATLWALFVSQGLLVPGLAGGEGGGGEGGEGEASADQEEGSQEEQQEQQEQKPEMTAEEAALARVAALAPEPEPAAKKAKA